MWQYGCSNNSLAVSKFWAWLHYVFVCALFFSFHFCHFPIGIDIKSQEDDVAKVEDIHNTNETATEAASKPISIENEKPNELILRAVSSLPSTSRSSSTVDKIDAANTTDDDAGTDEEAEYNKYMEIKPRGIQNKPLRAIQSLPYFSIRPASETDIFTIAGSSMISMTPEIPSISYTTLPKNYADTPTIEKYKESVSLYSIQTTNMERVRETDFSMPRYYGKSDKITQSVDNLSTTSKSIAGRAIAPKKNEISKRLKLLRANLPPLAIHINKEKSKERNIEWCKRKKASKKNCWENFWIWTHNSTTKTKWDKKRHALTSLSDCWCHKTLWY